MSNSYPLSFDCEGLDNQVLEKNPLNKTRDQWELVRCMAVCGRRRRTGMEYLKMGHSIYQRSDAANGSTLSIAKNR